MKSLRTLAAVSLAVVMAGGFAVATMESANAATKATITVAPATNLKNNQKVTVTGKGFKKSTTIYVLECSGKTQATCDITHLLQVKSSAKGGFTTKLTVRTGKIGSTTVKKGGKAYVIASDQASTVFKQVTFKK